MIKFFYAALLLAIVLGGSVAQARPRSDRDVRLHGGHGHGQGRWRDSDAAIQGFNLNPALSGLFLRCKKLVGREFRTGRGGRGGKIGALRQFRIDACVRGGGSL